MFSPAYWTVQPAFDFMAQHLVPKDARLFMLMGEKEGGAMAPDVKRMAGVVQKSGHPAANAVLKIVPGAEHNEALRSGELREALLWMFEDGKAASVQVR